MNSTPTTAASSAKSVDPAGAPAPGPATRAFIDAPHRLLIGGEWVDAADGRTFETIDPATERTICAVAHAGTSDVDRAVKAARAAFGDGQGAWPATPAARRAQTMHRLADLIEENRALLAELESIDNGKPVAMAERIDVPGAADHLRYYAGWATKIEGETLPTVSTKMLAYTRREPVGVCAQIIPWNFPLIMAAWKIAPALAAGCTVVLKPAEQTPLSALRLGELIAEAGFPDGAVNILTGDGATGAALVEHPGVDKIAFTGSTAVGREIGATAGRMIKRVTLELGGKSPNIILPDADLDAAITGSFFGMYFNSGQVCSAGSRLYVHDSQHDEVVERLAKMASGAKVGPGLDRENLFGPVVSAEQFARVSGYINAGIEAGATVAAGGPPHGGANGAATGDADGTAAGGAVGVPAGGGYFINPTLFTGATDDMSIVREEIFGPVLVALPYESVEDVARRANDTEYGLAAGVWTRDLSQAHKLAALLRAGTIFINGWGSGDASGPFGGFKSSGIGREKGRAGLEPYLETKTVWTNLG